MILLHIKGFIKRGCKCTLNLINRNGFTTKTRPPWNIMFFGTDDFSLYSLKSLTNELKKGVFLNNLEVVTSLKAKNNPVYKYAFREKLKIHDWPLKVLSNKFDIGVVVSFGHLIPEDVINRFDYGILNVHASLLPRWRGAAPIIHAIANEDSVTGVTIMRIQPKKFDIGDIVEQQSVEITKNITMPDLYHILAKLGATTLIDCLHELPQCLDSTLPQSNVGITYAPKVTWQMGVVNFAGMPSHKICALGRALCGLYPLTATWNNIPVKLYDICINPIDIDTNLIINKIDSSGFVIYDKITEQICVQCSDNKYVSFKKIGILGKKPMTAKDFNNGYLKKEIIQNRLFR